MVEIIPRARARNTFWDMIYCHSLLNQSHGYPERVSKQWFRGVRRASSCGTPVTEEVPGKEGARTISRGSQGSWRGPGPIWATPGQPEQVLSRTCSKPVQNLTDLSEVLWGFGPPG